MKEQEKFYFCTFSTGAGRAVLDHMRRITYGQVFGPNVTNEQLRWHAAQCAFVKMIERMVSDGGGLNNADG